MRKSLWMIASGLLLATICAPGAKADSVDLQTYAITFSFSGFSGSGILPTQGTFTYDPDLANFTSFTVTWDGVTFDLAGAANTPLNVNLAQEPCTSVGGGAASFAFLTGACAGQYANIFWQANYNSGSELSFFSFSAYNSPSDIPSTGSRSCPTYGTIVNTSCIHQDLGYKDLGPSGQWVVTPVATPEPGSGALMLTGIGLLGLVIVLRKLSAKALAVATGTDRSLSLSTHH